MQSLDAIREAQTKLEHRCDGPITSFVLISRACESANRSGDPELYANALYDALVDFGCDLRDGKLEVTGS